MKIPQNLPRDPAHQASMIKTAIDSKKEEDTYHASAAYRALKYKEEHPVYIRRDGTRVVPDSLADMTYGSGSGTPNYVEFRIGKKWISFYQTEPGIFKERK